MKNKLQCIINLKAIFILFLLVAASTALQSQVVSTQYGYIEGNMNGLVHEFLGIPFAKPPVDSLRWKAPRNPDVWLDTMDASSFAPACPQKSYEQGDTNYTLLGDEDCLYLNVWTPQTGIANKPVMVFIHGGGNQQGSANEINANTPMYFGKNLAERGNVVVVTIQYRLGPLGFMVHPGLEQESVNGKAGNYAVLDQILALKWIKNNISNFGGDTTRVMIFGESAGGVNVGNLLVSPLSAGLFQRACIQSAVPVVNDYADSKSKGIAFVDSFISTGTDAQKIAFMRSLDADSLLAGMSSPLEGGIVQMNWQPSLDNYVFTSYPEQAFQSGNFNKVPLMIGSNSEEMSLSSPLTVTPGMLSLLIATSVPLSYQSQVQALYPGSNNAEARASYVGILTDAQFTATARRTARCVSQNQSQPVWRYFYTHKHTIPQLAPLGAYHGMELFYVFNNFENAIPLSSNNSPLDDSVQMVMLKYWSNFAATGDPNGTGMVSWPQYQSSTDCYMEIKPTPNGSQCGLRTVKSDLWDDVIAYAGCTSSVGVKEMVNNNTVIVYPNPATGLVHLDVEQNKTFKVRLMEFTGKEVFSARDVTSIDVSACSPGVYIMVVEQGGKVYHSKFVKQ
ncbi:MAG: carboxylesterase family protein [Bacteroidia bacterium]|jgi:para-nitrobenzyl esterase